jgi:hypothetical protein
MHDKKTGKPISNMRLGRACTMGANICGLSAYWGQYSPIDEIIDIAPFFKLNILAFSQDFTPQYNYLGRNGAAYAFVFPQTNLAFQYAYATSEHHDHYIRFFSDEKAFPDFGGIDVWIFEKCKNNSPQLER